MPIMVITMTEIPEWIINAGALTQESKLDKRWKEQRPHRARIIVAGLLKKKSNDEIEDDLRRAGLFCSNHWVDRWIRYYKWKMSIGEIDGRCF